MHTYLTLHEINLVTNIWYPNEWLPHSSLRHTSVIARKFFRFECAPLDRCRIILVAVATPFHRRFPSSSSACTFRSASKSPARELVSQSALCIRRFEMHGRRVRGNRAGVRDVTLAVVTISIPRFEPPPRIADCGRVRDGSDVRIQTGMSAASGVSIMRATAKRALTEVRRVRIFESRYVPKPQYVP